MLNFDWLADISMPVAKSFFLILFAMIGFLVLLLPKAYIYEGLKVIHWYHNLKLWAIALLIFIGYVYYIF